MNPPLLQVLAQFRQSVGLLLACGLELHELERSLRSEIVNTALQRTAGNQSQAAKLLGIHRNTLGREVAVMRRRGSLRISTRRRPGGIAAGH